MILLFCFSSIHQVGSQYCLSTKKQRSESWRANTFWCLSTILAILCKSSESYQSVSPLRGEFFGHPILRITLTYDCDIAVFHMAVFLLIDVKSIIGLFVLSHNHVSIMISLELGWPRRLQHPPCVAYSTKFKARRSTVPLPGLFFSLSPSSSLESCLSCEHLYSWILFPCINHVDFVNYISI